MIEKFNDFPWHDAELKEIIIDRVNRDLVSISLIWPEDIDSDRYSLVEFFDCYGLKANMNFGHTEPDSIYTATCGQDCTDLDQVKSKWKKMGVDLYDLYCFRIETISTGSEIKIFAKSYKLTNKLNS